MVRHKTNKLKIAKRAWWLFFLGEGFHTYGVTGNIFTAIGDAFLYGALWLVLYLGFTWCLLPTLEDIGKHAVEQEEQEEK